MRLACRLMSSPSELALPDAGGLLVPVCARAQASELGGDRGALQKLLADFVAQKPGGVVFISNIHNVRAHPLASASSCQSVALSFSLLLTLFLVWAG